jgi:radical SAM superfamily enzyme YgiQ (UPF0313 family)
MNTLKSSGLKTITLAPESTWKIRKMVNKAISDLEIVGIIKKAYQYDLNVKLYFMAGLPGETEEDLLELVDLVDDIESIPGKSNALRISINPFIPKPHTPFQWENFDFKSMKKKFKYIKSHLKNVNLKLESPRMALIQYVLAQGNKELGEVIQRSVQSKVTMKDWEKRAPRWDLDSELPWKNIDVGIQNSFLKEEYLRALNDDITPWCETFGCYDCGACSEKNRELIIPHN